MFQTNIRATLKVVRGRKEGDEEREKDRNGEGVKVRKGRRDGRVNLPKGNAFHNAS